MKMDPALLQRAKIGLQHANVSYARTDEGVFRVLKWLYYICLFWTFGVCCILILSHIMHLNSTVAEYSNNELAVLYNILYFTIILAVVFLVDYILILCKKNIIPSAINAVLAFIGLTVYGNLYEEDIFSRGIGSAFYTRHGFPLFIIMVVCIAMFIIALRQRIIERKAYDRLNAKLYRQYKDRAARLSQQGDEHDTIVLSEEEWRSFLRQCYDEDTFAPEKLKRSRKQKAKKQKVKKQAFAVAEADNSKTEE